MKKIKTSIEFPNPVLADLLRPLVSTDFLVNKLEPALALAAKRCAARAPRPRRPRRRKGNPQ